MREKWKRLDRFLASVVVVNVVLFVIPALLWMAVGWPLPDAMPTTDELRALLEPGGVSEEAVVKFFAIIGWLSWARVAWALLDELVGALYGRAPRTDGSFSISQKFAEWAIAGLFRLGVSSAAVMGVAGAPATMAVVTLAAAPAAAETPPEVVVAPEDDENDVAGQGTTVRTVSPLVGRVPYEVVEGDTFWDISERHLGDAFRWREIYESAVGVSQPFAYDKAIESPDLIWPGSIVLLPEDAVNLPKVDPARVAAVWGDGAGQGSVDAVRSASEAVSEAADDVSSSSDADDMLAGLEAAASDAVAGVAKPEMEPPVVTSTTVVVTAVPETVPAQSTNGADQDSAVLERGWLSSNRSLAAAGLGSGGVLFASWMFVRLSRRRRARQMVMERNQRPAPLPQALRDAQRDIALGADVLFAEWLGAAWGSMASRPLPGSSDAAVPLMALLGKTHLQVLLSGYDPNVVGPWSLAVGANEEACIWEVDLASPVEAFGEIPEWMTLPLMVTVGDTMMANLEAMGLLSVFGDEEKSAGFVRSILSEMRAGPHGDFVDVKVSTAAAGTIGAMDSSDVETINADLLEWFAGMEALVTSEVVTSVSSARAESPAEWAPVVLVCTDDELDGFADLVVLAENPQVPLAIVCMGATASKYRAEISPGGQLIFGPKQLRAVAAYADALRGEMADRLLLAQGEVVELTPEEVELRTTSVFSSPPGMVPLSEEVVEEVLVYNHGGGEAYEPAPDDVVFADEAYLEPDIEEASSEAFAPDARVSVAAESGEVPAEVERPVSAEESSDEIVVPSSEELPAGVDATNDAVVVDVRDDKSHDESNQLVLSVLGDVRLRGVELSQVELSIVTFLMMTGHQSAWAIRSAIWEDEISTGHWERVVSTLRGKIGRAHFPHAEGGQYGLVGVHTDYSLFLSLWEKSKASSDDQAKLESLHSAMELVRGIPLQVGTYDRYWSWVFNHDFAMASELENNVVEAAMDMASLALSVGEMEHARFACVQGTLASPSCERLTSLMVQIYVQQGDHGKAARLVESFERQARDICPGAEPPEGPRQALKVRAS